MPAINKSSIPGLGESLDRIHAIDREWNEYVRQAKEEWTPGDACSAILECLDRMDRPGSKQDDKSIQAELRWLVSNLHRSVERAVASASLDPAVAHDLFTALHKHDEFLTVEECTTAPAVVAARELVRMEILYLVTFK